MHTLDGIQKTMTPNWFTNAIAENTESFVEEVLGKNIHYRLWGELSQSHSLPGLLFVHGHAAQSHWWDFIAPSFSQQHRTGAMDLSGNGESDHRDLYKASQFAQEIVSVAKKIGPKTIVVAHSFGGSMARIAAHLYPEQIGGLILIDSVISPHKREAPTPGEVAAPRLRQYESIEQAAKRFRLRPPQPKPETYIIDHIAKHSIRKVGNLYQFKLDPQVFDKMWPEDEALTDGYSMIKTLSIPCAYIWGQHSRFCPPEAVDMLKELFDENHLFEIKNAYHHLFLDQPQDFIETLKIALSRLRVASQHNNQTR